MKATIIILALFASLTTAHFTLTYPPARGDNKSLQAEFPCGGLAKSTKRTQISLKSPTFPISVNLTHDETTIQFLLAIGSEPETNYNVTLSDTFRVEGKGEFCLPDNIISEDILERELEDELDLMLQVQMNGYPRGGLYACADIQLVSEALHPPPVSVCRNCTGVTAIPFEGIAAYRSANASTADGHAQGSEVKDPEHEHGHEHHNNSTSSSNNLSDTNPESTDPTGEAMRMASWEVMSLAAVGGIAVLLTGALGI